MQDPPTPSPSDPEQPDSGSSPSKKSPKVPLKLKPLGKPESPPKPETPPAPTPPAESKEESDLDKKRNALKLRRMIIKDVEINPHKDPEAEPTPEAQPYEEPEEPPPPEDLKSVMEAPVPPEDVPPQEPPQPEAKEPEEPPQPEAKTLAGHKPVPVEPPKTEEPEPKKISTARKLIAGFAFVTVFALAGMLAIVVFKPFGKNLAPIEHNRLPVPSQQADSAQAPQVEEAIAGTAEISTVDDQQALQLYLDQLQGHRLILSEDPRGIFVDSVFVPEGAILDPRIGLSLSQILQDSEGTVILLQPEEGPAISIPLNGI